METRPPKVIETIVGSLVPSCRRETVLGDLYEGYTSVPQYVLSAARTVPYVILSRLIGTSDAGPRLAESGALYAAFVGAVWQLSGTGFLYEQAGLARATIPALAGLGALAMRDAYADTRGSAVLDAGIASLLAVCSQVALTGMGSHLALPTGAVVLGCFLSVPTVWLVRILLRPDDRTPRPGS